MCRRKALVEFRFAFGQIVQMESKYCEGLNIQYVSSL